MIDNHTELRIRIIGWLTDHRDSTTIEIARGIGADPWDVQHAVCHMDVDGLVRQVGKRETDDGRPRPVWSLAPDQEGA